MALSHHQKTDSKLALSKNFVVTHTKAVSILPKFGTILCVHLVFSPVRWTFLAGKIPEKIWPICKLGWLDIEALLCLLYLVPFFSIALSFLG